MAAKKLTAGVLNGAEHTENVVVEWAGESFEVDIRPLTNSEASEIEALGQEGVNLQARSGASGKMERRVEFDNKKNTYARNRANVKTVALGTTDESITEQIVEEQFPPKIVREVAKRVRQLTGVDDEEDEEESSSDQNGVKELNEGKTFPGDGDSVG